MQIIKLALPEISQSLANIYNASIYAIVFPTNFKKARLPPVCKKDSSHDKNNYKPISVLEIIPKPLERHVASSYLEYLTNNGLLYSKQSAYRPGLSCETALLSLTDNWLNDVDDSKLVGSVFLDLSRAFDLVSLDILLSEIAKYHGSQPTLRWFRSYLCDRTQTCAISGVLSDLLTLTQGVPQGSILGPILLSLYINDLPLCLPASDVEIYAEDTTLWTSDHSIDNIQYNLQNSLNNASRILGDPRAVSRAGRKGGTKVFKLRRKSP